MFIRIKNVDGDKQVINLKHIVNMHNWNGNYYICLSSGSDIIVSEETFDKVLNLLPKAEVGFDV